MPEEEPVCDCEEGEPPDPEPGCGEGEEITCPPGYVSCGATGGTFILDSDLEWTWVNDEGCPEGCGAFKDEQPTAEEEAAGYETGDLSYDGICCELEPGCCTHWNCVYNGTTYQYTATGTTPATTEADCIMPVTEFSGDPSIPCNSTPLNMNNNYNTWSAEPCIGGLSVPSDRPVEVMESPCSQEECEDHVSTWMAEPSGEPNEEGLYKVKWILLDDCPGACCSDQPTQPEFVKTSIIVDAPCKCGCA